MAHSLSADLVFVVSFLFSLISHKVHVNATSELSFSGVPSGTISDAEKYSFTIEGSAGATTTVSLIISPKAVNASLQLPFVAAGPVEGNTSVLDGGISKSYITFSGIQFSNGNFQIRAQADNVQSEVLEIQSFTTNLKIAGLYPRGLFRGFGDNAEVAVKLVSSLYSDKSNSSRPGVTLLPHTTLDVVAGENSGCNEKIVASALFSTIISSKPNIVIGPGCSSAAFYTARTMGLSANLNTPVCSYGASSALLDKRISYPHFLRTMLSTETEGLTLIAAAKHLKFTKVLLILMDDFPFGTRFFDSFEPNGLSVVAQFTLSSSNINTTKELSIFKESGIRVIMCLAFGESAQHILVEAVRLGIAGPGFVWLMSSAAYDSTLLSIGKSDNGLKQEYNATHDISDFYVGSIFSYANMLGGDERLIYPLVTLWNSEGKKEWSEYFTSDNPTAAKTSGWTSEGGPTGGLITTGANAADCIHFFALIASQIIYRDRIPFSNRVLSERLQSTLNIHGYGGDFFMSNGSKLGSKRNIFQLRRDPASSLASVKPTSRARNSSTLYIHSWASFTIPVNITAKILPVLHVNEPQLLDPFGYEGMMWSVLSPNGTKEDPPNFLCDIVSCIHGRCSGSNECFCEEGWTSEFDSRQKCNKPICTSCNTDGFVCVYPETLAEKAEALNGTMPVFCEPSTCSASKMKEYSWVNEFSYSWKEYRKDLSVSTALLSKDVH